jgi:hypothetical protein
LSRQRQPGGEQALLAEVAALVVDGGHELDSALRRAARTLGVRLQQARPPVAALRAAIADYRALFRPQQVQRLQEQRRLALTAMQRLGELRPRLIGSLIHGDGPLDHVRLLVYADTPEQVALHLEEHRLPWQATDTVLVYSGGRRISRPALRFMAGETVIELVVLDHSGHSDPPRDPVTGGTLEMLNADQLSALI